jgi:flagellar protein FlaI
LAHVTPPTIVKAVEGDSERCDYSIQAIGDHIRLKMKCKGCEEKASLLERRCRNSIIGILLDEPEPDSMILAGLVETLYEGDAIALVHRMAGISGMIRQYSRRSTGDAERCAKCKRSPTYIFGKLAKAFRRSLPSFQREMAIQSSGLSTKKERCKECTKSTRSDLDSLSSEMDNLKSFVLRGAFRISGRRTAISVEPRPLVTGMKRILVENSSVRPCFSSSWLASHGSGRSDVVTNYEIEGEEVELCLVPEKSDCIYRIAPMEYQLPTSHIRLIDLVLSELMEHYPENVSLESLEQTRSYVRKEAERLISELSAKHDIVLGSNRMEELENVDRLAEIVAKYTSGLGVIEVLLKDDHIQDVYVDAPASSSYVHVTLSGVADERVDGKLETNIRLGEEAAESLLSKFRLESGRPFSESMPILEHNLPSFGTRVTVVGPPLSPKGVAIALRRHSTRPWTLLKLIANKTLSAEAAGLISFLIDGRSTILVAGSRGAGKSSLLGAMMLEFPQTQRIITIEDTLELPTSVMQELGFKVQSLYVQSSLGGKGQMTADEALRVSLRLGESALVLGEVRGQEARTLYEAMRAGTAGSSVMGTFHADSATAVSERVVHDMGIHPKSFTATDIVIVCGLTRPGGTQKERRRVVQIAEVVKEDVGFRDLMLFEESEDRLVAGNVRSERVGIIAKSWGVDIEKVWDNIRVRGRIRESIVRKALEMKKPELLEAPWVIRTNDKFRQLVDIGKDMGEVQREWEEWLNKSAGYA